MENFIKELQDLCNKYNMSIIGEDILYKDGQLIEGEVEIISEEEVK